MMVQIYNHLVSIVFAPGLQRLFFHEMSSSVYPLYFLDMMRYCQVALANVDTERRRISSV
jgi:hypothetical protein